MKVPIKIRDNILLPERTNLLFESKDVANSVFGAGMTRALVNADV